MTFSYKYFISSTVLSLIPFIAQPGSGASTTQYTPEEPKPCAIVKVIWADGKKTSAHDHDRTPGSAQLLIESIFPLQQDGTLETEINNALKLIIQKLEALLIENDMNLETLRSITVVVDPIAFIEDDEPFKNRLLSFFSQPFNHNALLITIVRHNEALLENAVCYISANAIKYS